METSKSLKSLLESEDFIASSDERVGLIEKLLSIGTALSDIHDLGELLHRILSGSREITLSDAGSVYLLDKTEAIPKLIFKVAQNDSLFEDATNDSQPKASFFKEFAINITPESLAGYVALTGESLNLHDAYDLPSGMPYKLDQNFDRDFLYRTRSVLVLPMQNPQGEVIGVLQLINRKVCSDAILTPDNTFEMTQPYSDWEERIVCSLASQAAISIERNSLEESIENLFEGFVRASVQVIEARDPTTSGHSERVAALTVQLAKAINEIDIGPLGKRQFSTRQIQEIRYAALLHDFGKVGVPEAILNKQKKLYPEQLKVIRQRFAFVQRTLEMECAQNKYKYLIEHPSHLARHPNHDSSCPYCQQLEQLDRQLETAITKLHRYYSLIEQINEPEVLEHKIFETFFEEALQELDELAKYTYRNINGQLKPLLEPNEIEQLMLPRGNLTTAERLAIEAHVTHSYAFLKRIPWTTDLQNIPLIAYGHHEKLDGTGYPQGLRGDAIPIQTQMMTVADIYDALTAADRPYKQPLPTEIVLQILREEADKGKVNADLVDLFEQKLVFRAADKNFWMFNDVG
ncbi:HD domain-containing phosphohydrolase [Lusitaniella coriacea]|uniref:HD-GYP domain-containing protein n=1 Tax=Lusitaniella coriacea TaxID=1983105 RepID=UPI003CE8943F